MVVLELQIVSKNTVELGHQYNSCSVASYAFSQLTAHQLYAFWHDLHGCLPPAEKKKVTRDFFGGEERGEAPHPTTMTVMTTKTMITTSTTPQKQKNVTKTRKTIRKRFEMIPKRPKNENDPKML